MQYTAELHGLTRFISMQDQYNLLAREGGASAFSQAARSSAAPCSATGRWSRPALHRKPQVRQAKANRWDPVMTCHRYDRPPVTKLLGHVDGAIHTASPGDASSANLDSAVVDAVTDAFGGTGKPYLQISGQWIYGANTFITEESPFNAPPLVSWKLPIERRVLDTQGIRGVVIVSGTAYGDGGGEIPGLLLESPRDEFRHGSYRK